MPPGCPKPARTMPSRRTAREEPGGAAMERDVVCGMQIDPQDAAAQMEYQGKTYYFCSEDCHEKFMQNPQQYAGQQQTAR